VSRGERDEEILRIELALHAEATADVDLDHIDVVFANAQHRRERAAVEEQHLRRAEHREPLLRRVPLGDLAACLQRQPGQPMAAEAFLAGVFGFGKGGIGVAE
jgi:hypothetical protein